MPKMFVGVVCDSTEEAAEVAAAFAQVCNLPYSLTQWGANFILSKKKQAQILAAESAPAVDEVKEQTQPPGPDLQPPGIAVAFITSKRREEILTVCATGATFATIRRHIKAPEDHTQNIMRYLWEHKEVTFDGERYTTCA